MHPLYASNDALASQRISSVCYECQTVAIARYLSIARSKLLPVHVAVHGSGICLVPVQEREQDERPSAG